MIKIFGHRGCVYDPENTISSFKTAISLGVDFIEIDLRKTKDDHIVVFHDRRLERMTGVLGKIKNKKFSSLSKLKVMKKEKIYLFKDVLHFLKGKVKINIHIKEKGFEHYVVDLIERNDMQNEVLISSYIHSVLEKVKKLNKNIKTALLFRVRRRALKKSLELKCYAIHPYHRRVTRKMVEWSHKNGLKINPHTVNSKRRMKQLINAGVDGIITDRPAMLGQIIKWELQ